MKIAFIDPCGLCYDGNTLTKRGLGGSESAVILCARELAKLGFEVTVFNDCTRDDVQPGYYDNVWYRPLQEIESTTDSYDVLIGSRSVATFAPTSMRAQFESYSSGLDFLNIQQRSNHKVLWMHDTFNGGDDLIEQLLLDGFINEVFVLSDWHNVYVTTHEHGKRRMFEVMKKYMFVTRNGITKYHDWVDVTKKNPNHFVYNAWINKGMRSLVNNVWPRIRELIPDAKLTVIGGYYSMGQAYDISAEEAEWRQMVVDNPDINFTGVIKQSEIADILCDASYMIYPADYPETFGISTLESLYYNTPVITCYFGALEETAFDAACYKMPYCVSPNGLYPNINQDEQVEKFVELTMEAYNDKYIHQQKMYACNAVKDICGWDTVALQWKQHLFHKLGEFMPVDEYRKAQEINYKVRKTFGRRFINEEELQPLKYSEQKRIGVITAVYNAENYIEKCIRSVAAQDYEQYHMYIIDDASTDNTVAIARETIESLPPHLGGRFTVLQNSENVGAVANHFDLLKNICNDDIYDISYDLYMIVDGDDWLVNDPNIFHRYNNLYHDGAQFTYGSCWSLVDNIPLVAQPYPPEVKAARVYRNYRFNWGIPYTHLRTFHTDLVKDLTENDLKISGKWPRAGGDNALFYYLIEQADPDKVICVSDINYVYNDANPLNDYKVNGDQQNKTANEITTTKAAARTRQYDIGATMKKYNDLGLVIIERDWPAIEQEICKHVTDWSVCVQAGGHFGLYPTELSKMFAKVHTFEPYAENYVELIENCGGNDNISCYPSALSAYVGAVDILHLEGGNSGMNITIPGEEVQAVTIDSLKLSSCGLIQLDIERHEMFALMGAIETIEKFKPVVILEGPETTNNVCNAILANMGYAFVGRAGVDSIFKYTAAAAPETQYSEPTKKKILIAIPTNKYIEPETFKSIYDLIVPDGYEADFQFFYGYQIDQIRNLIADWGKWFDYLFSVDSDIILPNDTLVKMLAWDKDIITGVYIQRNPDRHIPEIYLENEYGGVVNTTWENIKHNNGLCEIAGCGFGCVLVKSEVLREMEYPHFFYSSAIDHSESCSEDIYFCIKARGMGYKIWCDTTIQCDHVGAFIYKVEGNRPAVVETTSVKPKQAIVIRTHDDALSYAYADLTDQSCHNAGLEVVKWWGFNKNKHNSKTLFDILGVKFGDMDHGEMCASASHFGAWKYMASLETNDPIVILEHDALMLHNIPEMSVADLDNKIIALGYKIVNPHEYDYKTAGAPEQIIPRARHSGSHAYMITPKTARLLVKELTAKGSQSDIDNFYFMRTNIDENGESDIPLALMVPTPAIGWIRKSTLRDIPSTLNYDVHESFSKNHHQ